MKPHLNGILQARVRLKGFGLGSHRRLFMRIYVVPTLLGHLSIFGLCQTVLFQQCIDFVGSPKVVVDLPRLGPANCCEFD